MAGPGWITLHREVADSWVWNAERFSFGQAWVDLLIMVNYQDCKLMIDGQLVTVPRGAIITSQVKLAKRWRWKRDKVKRFLDQLESDGMATIRSSKRYTFISINNYRKYQDYEPENATNGGAYFYPRGSSGISISSATDGATLGASPGASMGATLGASPGAQNNNSNNINNDNKGTRGQAEAVIRMYDEICVCLPMRPALTDRRMQTIMEAMQRCSMDGFRELFTRANASDFLTGHNDRGWAADFDWLMQARNMEKVFSGKFDNRGRSSVPNGASGRLGQAELEAIQRLLHEDDPPETDGQD